ncbi:MAG: hypothetical protein KDA53_02125 [Hyphomonas sp.]|nr:hypothetical protein [Hyphomonas sp.]
MAEAQLVGPPQRAPDMLVTSVALDDLRLLVDDLGGTFLAAGQNDAGAPFVFARLPEGLTLGIYTVCTDATATDCRGVEFMAAFGSALTDKDVAAIDRAYSAISVYKPDPDTVHVSRYVILDHGVTWANLRENAVVFEALCARVSERLSGSGPDVPPSP